MTLFDLVQGMVDQRLPQFEGAGIKREGAQVSFGRGRGKFFLCQALYVEKRKNKVVIKNTPTAGGL